MNALAPEKPATVSLPATMKAAMLAAPRTLRMVEAAVPKPAPHQALVRVEACGVCASNLPRWEGRPWFQYPAAPGEMGHEGVGRIVAMGARVAGWRVGEDVSFLSNHAYAEYDVADASAMVRVPRELAGAMLPGEPLGCAWNIFTRSGIRASDTVAIVGVGFLGAQIAQLALHAGARVLLVARRPFAAAGTERAERIVSPNAAEAISEAERVTDRRLCDVAIEATGRQEPLDLAARLTRERGRLVIAGYHQDGPRQVDMQLWNWRGLDVINAHERDPAVYASGMRAAYEAVRRGRFDPRPLLTHHLPLGELGRALELASERPAGFMKAIVHP